MARSYINAFKPITSAVVLRKYIILIYAFDSAHVKIGV